MTGCIYGGNIESEWVYIWWEQRERVGVYMVGTERVSGCMYGGNRERVSECIYGGNRESEWVYIWWEHRE